MPRLLCWTQTGSQYYAIFGYANNGGARYNIPYGIGNTVHVNNKNQVGGLPHQPVTFMDTGADVAWLIESNTAQDLVWIVSGNRATSAWTDEHQRCPKGILQRRSGKQ